jgi:hypothetical protein
VCKATGSCSYDTIVEQVFGFNADGSAVWDGVSRVCPNGTAPPAVAMCANGDFGTAAAGTPCRIPFNYPGADGTTYNACKSPGDYGGAGWCPTTDAYEPNGEPSEWGGCGYCDDGVMCADGVYGTEPQDAPCVFPFVYDGKTCVSRER